MKCTIAMMVVLAVVLILLSAVMAIILSPVFWIVVGILVLFQAISKKWGGRNKDEHQEYYYSENRSYQARNTIDSELQEEFTKDAVDVEVEVIQDDN